MPRYLNLSVHNNGVGDADSSQEEKMDLVQLIQMPTLCHVNTKVSSSSKIFSSRGPTYKPSMNPGVPCEKGPGVQKPGQKDSGKEAALPSSPLKGKNSLVHILARGGTIEHTQPLQEPRPKTKPTQYPATQRSLKLFQHPTKLWLLCHCWHGSQQSWGKSVRY